MAAQTGPGDGWSWDDRTWDEVWERVLDRAERHAIAMAVLRRRLPGGAMEDRIAVELSRRWVRKALSLAVLYLTWTLFWGALAPRVDDPPVPAWCAAVGVLAVGACIWSAIAFRRFFLAHRGGPFGHPT
jgi:hypothetical protein